MSFSDSFFAAKFGITRRDLENYLSEALGRGGDYADLYFEYLATSSISIDESIVKSATQGVSLGVGVRVISGERTGYAYRDDLSPEKIKHAAQVAAMIAAGRPRWTRLRCEEGKNAISTRYSPPPTRPRSTSESNWPSAPTARPALTIPASSRFRSPTPITFAR